MSFFDEDDEPRRRPRLRRPTGGVAVDPQTLRMRQGLLVGVGLLVVILLALGVRGCLSSAEKRGLRDYTDDVRALMERSDNESVEPFFEQLVGGAAEVSHWTSSTGQPAKRDLAGAGQGRRAPGASPTRCAQPRAADAGVGDATRCAGTDRSFRLAQATGGAADEAIVQITGQIQLFYASQLLDKWRAWRP